MKSYILLLSVFAVTQTVTAKASDPAAAQRDYLMASIELCIQQNTIDCDAQVKRELKSLNAQLRIVDSEGHSLSLEQAKIKIAQQVLRLEAEFPTGKVERRLEIKAPLSKEMEEAIRKAYEKMGATSVSVGTSRR